MNLDKEKASAEAAGEKDRDKEKDAARAERRREREREKMEREKAKLLDGSSADKSKDKKKGFEAFKTPFEYGLPHAPPNLGAASSGADAGSIAASAGASGGASVREKASAWQRPKDSAAEPAPTWQRPKLRVNTSSLGAEDEPNILSPKSPARIATFEERMAEQDERRRRLDEIQAAREKAMEEKEEEEGAKAERIERERKAAEAKAQLERFEQQQTFRTRRPSIGSAATTPVPLIYASSVLMFSQRTFFCPSPVRTGDIPA